MLTTPAHTVTGTVTGITRHGATYYGNPMLSVTLDVTAIDGTPAVSSSPVTVRISDNAGLVYEVGNAKYRDTSHTFKLTRAGRISHVVRG